MSSRSQSLVHDAVDVALDVFATLAPVLAFAVLCLASTVLGLISLMVVEGHPVDPSVASAAFVAAILIPISLSGLGAPLWRMFQGVSDRKHQRLHIRRRLRIPGFSWDDIPAEAAPARPPPAPLEDRMAVLHRRWPRREHAEQWTGDAVRFELARAAWSLRGWLAGRQRLVVRISAHELVVGRQVFHAGELRRVRLDGQRIVVHQVGERAWKSPRLLFADRQRVAELLARLDHSDAEIQEQSRAARAVRAALEPLRHLHK